MHGANSRPFGPADPIFTFGTAQKTTGAYQTTAAAAFAAATMPQQWDPREVLEIINPDRGYMTCVGFAPTQGRRCRNFLAVRDRAQVDCVLDDLARTLPAVGDPDLKQKLYKIAKCGLCVEYHQHQALDVVDRWLLAIRKHVPATPPAPSFASSQQQQYVPPKFSFAFGSASTSAGTSANASPSAASAASSTSTFSFASQAPPPPQPFPVTSSWFDSPATSSSDDAKSTANPPQAQAQGSKAAPPSPPPPKSNVFEDTPSDQAEPKQSTSSSTSLSGIEKLELLLKECLKQVARVQEELNELKRANKGKHRESPATKEPETKKEGIEPEPDLEEKSGASSGVKNERNTAPTAEKPEESGTSHQKGNFNLKTRSKTKAKGKGRKEAKSSAACQGKGKGREPRTKKSEDDFEWEDCSDDDLPTENPPSTDPAEDNQSNGDLPKDARVVDEDCILGNCEAEKAKQAKHKEESRGRDREEMEPEGGSAFQDVEEDGDDAEAENSSPEAKASHHERKDTTDNTRTGKEAQVESEEEIEVELDEKYELESVDEFHTQLEEEEEEDHPARFEADDERQEKEWNFEDEEEAVRAAETEEQRNREEEAEAETMAWQQREHHDAQREPGREDFSRNTEARSKPEEGCKGIEQERPEDAKRDARVRRRAEQLKKANEEKLTATRMEWVRAWTTYLEKWDALSSGDGDGDGMPPSRDYIPWPVKSGRLADVDVSTVREFYRNAPLELIPTTTGSRGSGSSDRRNIGEETNADAHAARRVRLLRDEMRRWHLDKRTRLFRHWKATDADHMVAETISIATIEVCREVENRRNRYSN